MAALIPGPHPVEIIPASELAPIPATGITVEANAVNGLIADDLQAALDALATRIKTLEP